MVEVPTKDEFDELAGRVVALEEKEMPQEVKDALLVVLTWMVNTLGIE